jgi:hypothetical protein
LSPEQAAAAAMVAQAREQGLALTGPDGLFIVAGDLNDEPEAVTTQLLHGPSGSELGTAGFDHPDSGDGQRLWNLAALIPKDQRFSRIYRVAVNSSITCSSPMSWSRRYRP